MKKKQHCTSIKTNNNNNNNNNNNKNNTCIVVKKNMIVKHNNSKISTNIIHTNTNENESNNNNNNFKKSISNNHDSSHNNNVNNNNNHNKISKMSRHGNDTLYTRFKKTSFMRNLAICSSMLYTEVFTYSTVRSANVNNKPVAFMYRVMQISILVYIIGYDLIWNFGYQATDFPTSTVTTKVQGFGYITMNLNNDDQYFDASLQTFPLDPLEDDTFLFKMVNNLKVLDTPDFIVPPSEFNSIFVMTNFIKTTQTPGTCEETVKKMFALCANNTVCQRQENYMNHWSGVPTGRCIESKINETMKVCEIFGWCPVEDDTISSDERSIANILNYTIFIKNDIEFSKFGKKEHNILPDITDDFITTCYLAENRDVNCPVFTIDYILRIAEPNEHERILMLKRGGIIQIEIIWKCNYDFYAGKCVPIYSFKRFDSKFNSTYAASGFNFRFANKFYLNGTKYRVLYKAYGLRIFITVTGLAGRFSVLPLMLSIGAGFGLMSISVLISDCVLLNLTKKKKFFQQLKEIDFDDINRRYPYIIKQDEM